ncbi:MAG TPA: ZmpA/ZmpB/ZmpC family metallo-endopeptidase-related protein, partial [Rhizomicrobium sp.]|nr:ZmpA/ZmpB/ZmpC family metallo-endopeptidase-related protein [Rhizomicrobium sp.]
MMRALFIAAPVLALLTAEASAVGEITFSISKSPTANVSCSNGLCEPTGGNANLNVSDLETLLAAGNLQINAYNGKFHARTVTVKDGFSWSAATGLTLAKLDVGKTISILGAGSLTSALSVKKEGKIQCADLSCNVDGYTPVNSLQGLASAIAANPQGNYALVHSYDASADGTYTASPIATNFLGNLYGLGNTISNISVANTTACCVAGLFQSLSEGNIYDLHLTNVSVTSTAGAAGFAYESFAEIFNSSVTGSINGGSAGDIGGFVADNYGTIRSSWSTAAVSTASSLTNANVGGLVGVNYGGLLFTYSTAAVRAGASVTDVNIGGLAGSNLSGIQGSFATGNVSTGDGSGNIGGLAGLNSQSGYLEGTYAEGA